MTPAEGELTGIEIVNVAESIDIRLGDGKNIIVNALYADGSSKPVTDKARFAISDDSVVRLEGTMLMAVSEGTAVVTVSYTSQAGVTCSQEVAVNVVSPFALTEAMFNPSIWETGSFDEDTHTLITGQYGFGGWQFSEGLDLSSYERLIVKLGNNNDCGVSFRLFDKDNYWTKPAMYDFHSSREVTVYLHDMKDEDGKKFKFQANDAVVPCVVVFAACILTLVMSFKHLGNPLMAIFPFAAGLACSIGYLTIPALQVGQNWQTHLIVAIVLAVAAGGSLVFHGVKGTIGFIKGIKK